MESGVGVIPLSSIDLPEPGANPMLMRGPWPGWLQGLMGVTGDTVGATSVARHASITDMPLIEVHGRLKSPLRFLQPLKRSDLAGTHG